MHTQRLPLPLTTIFLLAAVLSPADANAATFERRPYLQRASTSQITIVWNTQADATGELRWGTSPDQLDQVAPSAGGTRHEVTLTGLSEGTRYYYAVYGDGELMEGGDEGHYFDTHPAVGSVGKFRAWIVGDSGTGGSAQSAVRDSAMDWAGLAGPDLYLHVGDMAYEDGTTDEFTERFYGMYADILKNTVVWPALGNHEGHTSDSGTESGPYYEGYVLPRNGESGGIPSGTEAYYSFDYANAHFIVLDSYDTDRSSNGAMATWMEQDLSATSQDWIIAFWHHPPYSKGSHDSDTETALIEMRENMLPILEAGGVDLVLGGHSHIYERSFLLDGAYETPTTTQGILDSGDGKVLGDGPYVKSAGSPAHEGAVYVVAGHGGRGVGGDGNHPVMYFSEIANGSLFADFQDNRLGLTNVRSDGVITDRMTLIKGEGLIVGTPDGGEGLQANTSGNIEWATIGDIPNVDVLFSCDGGDNWEVVADDIPNTNSFSWEVPPVESYEALVKVVSASDESVFDESNGVFKILGSAPQPVVSFGAQWKYSDDDSDYSATFMDPALDDAAWPSGPAQLGYGDGDESTVLNDADPNVPSVYFRHRFNVDGPVTAATLTTLYDDGAVVYINGTQVASYNIGDPAHASWASDLSDDNSVSTTSVDAGVFVQGENVVAVMVKQRSGDSSDLSFDLALDLFAPGEDIEPCGDTPPPTSSTGDTGDTGDASGTGGTGGDTSDTSDTSGDPNADDNGNGTSGCSCQAEPSGGLPALLLLAPLLGLRRPRRRGSADQGS